MIIASYMVCVNNILFQHAKLYSSKTLLVLLILANVLLANAQALEQRGIEQNSDTTALREINVVAIKQQPTLWQQPVAVTALSESQMQRLNIVSVKGISDLVPNFYVPDYGSRITSSIYVRGIGSRMDQPAVGLIVDNIPVLNKDAYDFDVDDISSAQVLRGPQSTLYGRNTMGGLVNITTISPLNWQGGRVSMTLGNGEKARLNAGWYGLLGPALGLSVNVTAFHSSGFHKNIYNNEKTDRENNLSARMKLHWMVSENMSVQNVAYASLSRQGGYPYENVSTGVICHNDTCFYRRFVAMDGITLRYSFTGVTLAAVASVQHINDNMTLDQDFLPLDYFTITQKKNETALTFDLIVKDSKTENALYKHTTGLFAFYKHLNMLSPVTFKNAGISNLIEANSNNANPTYPIEWNDREFCLDSKFVIPTRGVALYHESYVNLERWHFTAGIRFDYERTDMRYENWCDTGYTIYKKEPDGTLCPFSDVDVNLNYTGNLYRQYLNVMPKIGVVADLPRSLGLAYINVSRGFKAGGFNTQMFSDVLQQRLMLFMGIGTKYDIDKIVGYKPEKSWNYEIGCKLNLLDSKLQMDADVFVIDCHDQQLTMFPDGNTTGRITTNAGHTLSRGCELSLRYRPLSNLQFAACFGYTKATFLKFFDGKEDFKGKRIPYVPENTLFLEAVYDLAVKNKMLHNLSFELNSHAAGNIYWNEANSLCQSLYALLGASVTADFNNCSLELWGKNLTNTKYNTFYFKSMSNEFVQRANPITFGVTFRIAIK